jgi:hypothetical protein
MLNRITFGKELFIEEKTQKVYNAHQKSPQKRKKKGIARQQREIKYYFISCVVV